MMNTSLVRQMPRAATHRSQGQNLIPNNLDARTRPDSADQNTIINNQQQEEHNDQHRDAPFVSPVKAVTNSASSPENRHQEDNGAQQHWLTRTV